MKLFRNYAFTGNNFSFLQNFLFHCFRIIFLLLIFFLTINIVCRAQCSNPPSLVFNNPQLISGTDGQVGAIYLFQNVGQGLDATIEVKGFTGGAGLNNIDYTASGYGDAWQPFITAGANDTSYLDWRISFKVAGTNTDTILPCLAITAIDVDGDNSSLAEFIQAGTPGAYAVDPNTILHIMFDGTVTTATATVHNVPNIDTAHREAMFQMNFTNVSHIDYRNGAISTKGSSDVRQTCIYFKAFFDTYILLPVQLLSFQALEKDQQVKLSWTVTDEKTLKEYAVQRSIDGKSWTTISRIPATGVSAGTHSYFTYDNSPGDASYYRLQQTDIHGSLSYSKVIRMLTEANHPITVKYPSIIAGSIPMQLTINAVGQYSIRLHTMQGQLVAQQQVALQPGTADISFGTKQIANGMYVLTITDASGNSVHSGKVIKQ